MRIRGFSLSDHNTTTNTTLARTTSSSASDHSNNNNNNTNKHPHLVVPDVIIPLRSDSGRSNHSGTSNGSSNNSGSSCSTSDSIVGGGGDHPDQSINMFVSLSIQREKEGKCISCGQQLYLLKSKSKGHSLRSLFFGGYGGSSSSSNHNSNHNNTTSNSTDDNNNNTNENQEQQQQQQQQQEEYRKKPLSIPGKVERGQCLICSNPHNIHNQGCNTSGSVITNSSNGSSTGSSGLNNNNNHSNNNHHSNNHSGSSGMIIDDCIIENTEPIVVSGFAEYNISRNTTSNRTHNNSNHVAVISPTSASTNGKNNLSTSLVVTAATPNNEQVAYCPNSTALYKGPYNAAGKRHGQGTMTWSNTGDIYIGEFVNGDRHGHGTIHFGGLEGGEYVGEWRHNLMAGIGTRRWQNGDCYTGDYIAGKRTGQGRFYFANGDMYTGEFYSDNIHGFGRYYYANGQRFEGYFHDGKRLGKGKIQRNDGTLDIGVYVNDVRVGTGVRWSPDRTETWKLENGIVKKKITIPEAVSLDYEMDTTAAQIAAQMDNEIS